MLNLTLDLRKTDVVTVVENISTFPSSTMKRLLKTRRKQ
jgi:hypothetical protein